MIERRFPATIHLLHQQTNNLPLTIRLTRSSVFGFTAN